MKFAQLVVIPSAQSSSTVPPELKSIKVVAGANDFNCNVMIEQHFVNTSNAVVRCRYEFPLDDMSAVYSFEAKLPDGVIRGLSKEKEQAQAEFKEALRHGQTAALLDREEGDLFACEIGNLGANEDCIIRIKYITTLGFEDPHSRFLLPTAVFPRYNPIYRGAPRPPIDIFEPLPFPIDDYPVRFPLPGPPGLVAPAAAAAAAAPAAAAAAPHPAIGAIVPPSINLPLPMPLPVPVPVPPGVPAHVPAASDAWLTIEVHVNTPTPLKSITCPTHTVTTTNKNANSSIVTLAAPAHLDQDFVLLIDQQMPYEPRAILEEFTDPVSAPSPATLSAAASVVGSGVNADGSIRPAVQITFCPKPAPDSDAPCELIVLVDRSGSMGGSRIAMVKETLDLILHSLPARCFFNIVSFGSSFSKLWPASRVYSQQTLSEASSHVSSIDANMGGTEILAALQDVLSAPLTAALPRQVFLLTDGEVSNADAVIQSTAKWAHQARVFTFGIGNGASRFLCRGIARAGGGETEFILNNSEISAKVIRQLSRALQPALMNVSLEWAGVNKGDSPSTSVLQIPTKPAPIFASSRYFMYALLPPVAPGEDHDLIKLKITQGQAMQGRPLHAHPLALSSPQVVGYQGGFSCDVCNAKYPQDASMWHCNTCGNYDECLNCYQTAKRAHRGPPHPHALSSFASCTLIGGDYAKGFGCDVCSKAGQPNETMFHCSICQNYDECNECFQKSQQPLEPPIELTLSRAAVFRSALIHRLAAMTRIRELTETADAPPKSAVVALATAFNLASPFTSFIAIRQKVTVPPAAAAAAPVPGDIQEVILTEVSSASSQAPSARFLSAIGGAAPVSFAAAPRMMMLSAAAAPPPPPPSAAPLFFSASGAAPPSYGASVSASTGGFFGHLGGIFSRGSSSAAAPTPPPAAFAPPMSVGAVSSFSAMPSAAPSSVAAEAFDRSVAFDADEDVADMRPAKRKSEMQKESVSHVSRSILSHLAYPSSAATGGGGGAAASGVSDQEFQPLVKSQTADGCWPGSTFSNITRITGKNQQALLSALQSALSLPSTPSSALALSFFATALALAVLNKQFAHLSSSSVLVVRKAKRWLTEQITSGAIGRELNGAALSDADAVLNAANSAV